MLRLLRNALCFAAVLLAALAMLLLAEVPARSQLPLPDLLLRRDLAAVFSTDPVPIQRVLVPAERLPAEMQRVRQGVLVQIPRDEFEGRLERLRQREAALSVPPRL